MNPEEYTKLPYIGKKRAKKLAEAGIGIVEIAKMDEEELKKYLPRISKGKLKVIIATAREIAGRMYDISEKLEIDEDKALILALEGYDVEKIAKAKREDIAKIMGISNEEAFNLIFKAALKTGVGKPKIALKSEEINHKGILSKEGFVNGFTQIKIEREKKFRILPFAIVLLLLVAGVSAIFYMGTPPWRIDGNFEEWKNVPGYTLENITYKYRYYSGSLYVYIHQNNMFSEEESFYLLISGGNDDGYFADGIKAKYVAEFYGWNDTLRGATLWRHVSSEYLWNFTRASGMIYAFGKDGIEFLLNNVPENANFILLKKGEDTVKALPTPVNQRKAYIFIRNLDDVAVSGKEILVVRIISPVKFHLNSLKVYCTGASLKDAKLINKMGEEWSGVVVDNSTASFDLGMNVKNDIFKLSFTYQGMIGSVVSFNVSIISNNMEFEYSYETSKVYLFSPPNGIKIDGAFGDWKSRISDSIGDVRDANIDIVNYSHTNDMKFIYFEVRGEIMGGDDVPIVRKWAPKDTDRDGVPDKIDPFPNDFNNDGISDFATDHDVDGDGFKDYPYGNDTWLNTTIPYDFPAPYAGRHMSVYIGPPPPVKPKNGNDTAEIYIGTGSSGAHLDWVPFPVNYKITITGRCGIYDAEMYKFESGKWVNIGKVDRIENGYHAIELSTGLNLNNAKLWITVFNWNHEYDSISLRSRVSRANTNNVFYLHGKYGSADFENMNWVSGSNEQRWEIKNTTFLGNGDDNASWVYENQITSPYYIQSAVAYLWVYNKTGGFTESDKYLNASLYAIHVNSNNNVDQHSLLMYSGWINVPQNDSNVHLITLPMSYVNNTTVYPHWYLVLYISYIEHFYWWGEDRYDDPSDSVIIYYNTTTYNSRVEITTNSTLEIEDVRTVNDTTRNAQNNFHKDEIVGIYANVIDPLGIAHIADATTLSIWDALGNTIISGNRMNRENDGFGYAIFYFSFQLSGSPYVYAGNYSITVYAKDKEGFSTQNSDGGFIVNSDVRQPLSKTIFVPEGKYSAWLRHLVINEGDSDDIFNFHFDSGDEPKFEVSIYEDNNWNKIIDSGDTLYAIYNASQGGWIYKKNDTDGNGEPDITVMYGKRVRIIIQENVSLSSTYPVEHINLTVYSFTRMSSFTVYDKAIIRKTATKTLYLWGRDNPPFTLHPQPGDDDQSYTTDKGESVSWYMTENFYNDFTLAGDIVIHVWAKAGEPAASQGHVELYMDGTILIGEGSFGVDPNLEEKIVFISPSIPMIPSGHNISLVFYETDDRGNVKKGTISFNSTDHPSRIEITTTSQIYVESVNLYNASSGAEQYNYSAGETVIIRTTVREPFGVSDIKRVIANVTAPDGAKTTLDMYLEEDHGNLGYWIYRTDYDIPSNAKVGKYIVNITAIEGNDVKDYGEETFRLRCNISIDPHKNSSVGTVVWYNHTIWNNGSGYDIINVYVTSNQTVNITLYVLEAGSWIVVAYSDTGTGWNYVKAGYDNDGNGDPDFLLADGNSVRIAIKVTTTANVSTQVKIYDIYTCEDYAQDNTVIPEINSPLVFLFAIPLIAFWRRRRRK